MKRQFFTKTNLLGILLLTIAYYMAARLGLLLSLSRGNASPVWPPSGISLAALLLGGYNLWPGIWLGSFIAGIVNFYTQTGTVPLWFVGIGSGIALGASLEGLLGAFLSKRLIGVRHLFNQGHHIFKFLAITLLSCTVSPTFGVASLCLGGLVPWSAFLYSWLTWWLGDIAGILVITPLAVTWIYPILKLRFPRFDSIWLNSNQNSPIRRQPNPLRFQMPRVKLLEAGFWLLLMGMITQAAFGYRYPVEYLLIPLLVWAAFRFGQRGTTLAIFLVSAIAVLGSVNGISSFIRDTLNESLLLLQAFIGSVTITTLVLSAVITERERAEAKLERTNEVLELRVEKRTAELKTANQEITRLNDRLKAENLRLTAELEITRQLQQMILPKEQELSSISDLEIAGFMEQAEEVGGDYYDVLNHNGLVKIGIGDVTGHGLESGVLMIMVQTAVRTLLVNNETNPVKFLNALNRVIYDNVQRMKSDKNLTLTLLDYQQGKLCLSGQHEEVILVRAQGDVERIDTIDLGFPIGLESDIADFVSQTEVQLYPGDVVVLYTDGITEAENNEGAHYGIERLCEVVKRNEQHSASEIRQAVIEDVRLHIGEQKVYDDITLLVLKQK